MLLSDLGKKIEDSHLSTQTTLLDLTECMDRMEKGKYVNIAYSTKDLTPNSAAPASTTNVEFGMPPNYFAGQTPPPGTVRPHRAELARPVASTDQTGAMVLASVSTPTLAPISSSAATAEQMNWKALYCHTLLNHTANHLSHLLCHKMFGAI